MAKLAWRVLALALATAAGKALGGCVVTARVQGGAALRPSGADGDLGARVGLGVQDRGSSGLLVSGGTAGANGAVVTTGIEYDRNLGRAERPWGLRVRGDLGAYLGSSGAVGSTRSSAAFALLAVPGLWWTALQSRSAIHRLILALELQGGLLLGSDDFPARGVISVNMVVQYDWVPCSIFGGETCGPAPYRRP
ncbi:MAG: hypothetical protein HY909_15630 [Deltaproteobacteria bacterium]|nr:hypothetical protein [Deltaproteobacteria bacterium]